MKSRILMCITATALFAALAIPPRLAAQRQTYTVLHSFAGPPTDGSNPFDFGSLVRDSAGEIYEAKIHWYECHGIGKRLFKIKEASP